MHTSSSPTWSSTVSSGGHGAHDRTAEFFSTADSFRRQRSAPEPISQVAPPVPASAINFNKAALEINRMIVNTTSKLHSLAKIAQTRQLFNDPSDKIAQLTEVIKTDLNTISSEIDILAKYGEEHQTGAKQVDGHTMGVVKDLKTKIADQAKMFQDVLKVRSANMRSQDSRRGQYSALSTSSEFGMRHRPDMHSSISATLASGPQSGMDAEQTQALLQAPSRSADGYLESRANAITNIDSTIQELGEMYQRLATIVSMQGEQLRRIDDNVVLTMGNVEGAHEHLVMYWDRMRSNRGLIIKVFLALIVFAVFFIGFIA